MHGHLTVLAHPVTEHRLQCSGTRHFSMQAAAALQHVGSSQTRERTHFLPWQAESLPLSHQRSLCICFLYLYPFSLLLDSAGQARVKPNPLPAGSSTFLVYLFSYSPRQLFYILFSPLTSHLSSFLKPKNAIKKKKEFV